MQQRKIILLVLLLALAVGPLVGGLDGYWLHVLNLTWVAAIAALGVTVATGMTGQIVLGQAALMGVGAYATALAMLRWNLAWWIALPGAIVLAAAIGVALGLLSMRIKGHYLAIVHAGVERDLPPGGFERGAGHGRPDGFAGHPGHQHSRTGSRGGPADVPAALPGDDCGLCVRAQALRTKAGAPDARCP